MAKDPRQLATMFHTEDDYKDFIKPHIKAHYDSYKNDGLDDDHIRMELKDAFGYDDLIDEVMNVKKPQMLFESDEGLENVFQYPIDENYDWKQGGYNSKEHYLGNMNALNELERMKARRERDYNLNNENAKNKTITPNEWLKNESLIREGYQPYIEKIVSKIVGGK